MILLIFTALTLLLLMLTLAPLLQSEVWWIRGWDFPRLQLMFFAIMLIAGQILIFDVTSLHIQILIGINIFCVLWLGWWIMPYTIFFKPEVTQARNTDREKTLRIMVANVFIDNRESMKLIQLVKENTPDILVTLESDMWWQQELDILESEYPYTIKCPLDNSYGMHVYSKLPLLDSKIRYLIENDVPSMRTNAVLPSGKKVQLHFLHPAPPSPTENETSEERDAELLIIAKEVATKEEPIVVMGDLNDVAWSHTTRLFRKISGLLDPRIGRGMFNTFHANYFFIRWPLDHLFHSNHFHLVRAERLPAFGSDHFPFFAEIILTGENIETDKGIDSTEEDEKEADMKIQKTAGYFFYTVKKRFAAITRT